MSAKYEDCTGGTRDGAAALCHRVTHGEVQPSNGKMTHQQRGVNGVAALVEDSVH